MFERKMGRSGCGALFSAAVALRILAVAVPRRWIAVAIRPLPDVSRETFVLKRQVLFAVACRLIAAPMQRLF
ncbi:hypothetical protein [Gordonibacter pamelaeae]|uniref:hypothetical protein n=1 Tax=Gordonibacter pamelaeae TaxID=471189 RepID=UPI002FE0A4BA